MVFRIKLADKVISIDTYSKSPRTYCRKYLVKNRYIPTDINIKIPRIAGSTDDELMAIYKRVACEFINYNTLLIHGSAISVDGKAYLFIAPSGTGKSTHTRLWREHFGHRALMVNDDKPLIKIEDDVVYACGTPWSGKHRLDNNVMVPLAGICFLERGETNAIAKLKVEDAYEYLLLQTFRPEEDDLSIRTFDLLDKLLAQVPFYKMQVNNFSEDAVETSYEGMTADAPLRLREYLDEHKEVLRTIDGCSMEPLLHSRQSVIKLVKVDSLCSKNDVVMFIRPTGKHVLHRIVKVRKNDYLICGDNQWKYEKVPHSWVLGLMTEYSPDGETFYTTDAPEYQAYVKKHCNSYWVKYYVKWIISFPGRAIRKIRCLVGNT